MPTFTANQLKKLSFAIFRAAGATEEEAETVTEILVAANLRGVDSHGVIQIPDYIDAIKGRGRGLIEPGAPIKVVRDTPTTALWDVNNGFGFVAGKKAMKTAIEKAKKYKIGMVATFNSKGGFDHIGALFYYARLAVEQDMIGIVTCTDYYPTAPYGGTERRLGINPIAIGIPTKRWKPILLDMGTAMAASGRLRLMHARGEKIPEGWLIAPDGRWVTDYLEYAAGKAAMVPFGEYKGYGLNVCIEAITGGFGAGCSLDKKGVGLGHTYTAIDPTGFCPIDEFKARVDSLIDHLKTSKLRPGFKEILYPGEKETREEERRAREGIFIDPPFWERIVKVCEELNVDWRKITES
jgi:uncharacterized oxidoreductase